MRSTSARWTSWYSSNREEYLAAKRKEYKRNSAERRRAKVRASESNERRGRYWENRKWSQPPVQMEVAVGGKRKRLLMFPIAYLARALGRQTQLVRLWDENGTIPQTPYRVLRGSREYRLYSSAMIESASSVVGAVLNGDVVELGTKEMIAQGVRAKWKKLGIPGMNTNRTEGVARERSNGRNTRSARSTARASSGGG